MRVLKIEVTPVFQNCRLIIQDNHCVIVDPGGEPEKLIAELNGLEPEEIWITHSHFDHIGGVKRLKETWPHIIIRGHPLERIFREKAQEVALSWGIIGIDDCPEPDVYISGDEVFEWRGIQIQTLFTPGHSPGHLCFYIPQEKILLCGDTVFRGSIGRTDLPGSDYDQLIASIKNKIFNLNPKTLLLPGHGPDTSIEIEMIDNPFLQGV